MLVSIRFVPVMIVCTAVAIASSAQARPSKQDAELLASKALGWALDGGLAGAKALPATAAIDVVAVTLPAGAELKVPGRTVSVSSLIRLQAEADVKADRPVFVFNSVVVRGERATVSLSLKWAVAVRSTATPPAVQGAVLEFERRGESWEIAKVSERWP